MDHYTSLVGQNDRIFEHHCYETNRATAVVFNGDCRCLCMNQAVQNQPSAFRNARSISETNHQCRQTGSSRPVNRHPEKATLLSLVLLPTLTLCGSPEIIFIGEIRILLNWPLKIPTAKLQTSVTTQRDSLR